MKLTSVFTRVRLSTRDPAYAAYWISPQGDIKDVELTHAAWAVQNIPELQGHYPRGWRAEQVAKDAMKLGWIRLRGDAVQVARWDRTTATRVKNYVQQYPHIYRHGITLVVGDRTWELSLSDLLHDDFEIN
jgi:hypothetical protein